MTRLLLALASLAFAAALACRAPRGPEPSPVASGSAGPAPAPPTFQLAVPGAAEDKLDLGLGRDLLPSVRRETEIRLVVDLAEQPDLVALGRQLDARGLPRAERKQAAAQALSAGVPSRRALAAELRARADVRDVEEMACLARVAFTGPARLAREMAARPDVAWVWGRVLDARGVPAQPPQPARGEGSAWALQALSVPLAWQRGATGRGAHVCVADSSSAEVPAALRGRLAASAASAPAPGQGPGADSHGFGVLSAAVGAGGIGVAPDATWSIVDPFAGAGLDPEAFPRAIDWLLLHAQPDVVVMPWDVPGEIHEHQLVLPIGALRTAGMAVVFPAGNSGPTAGANAAPANLVGLPPDGAPALSVGGINADGTPYRVSNRGPNSRDGSLFPLLAAPAGDVTVADSTTGGVRGENGTSFAAGFVGGALALVLGARPEMTGPAAERLLIDTARDVGSEGPDVVFGHGLVDVARALDTVAASGASTTPGPP